jgi:hypothetical protein
MKNNNLQNSSELFYVSKESLIISNIYFKSILYDKFQLHEKITKFVLSFLVEKYFLCNIYDLPFSNFRTFIYNVF